jgi:hypothetical protein
VWRWWVARLFFKVNYACDFRECWIEVNGVLDPLLLPPTDDVDDDEREQDDRSAIWIDLQFLDELLESPDEETFLVPSKIYFRSCTRRVFCLFREDVDKDLKRKPNLARSVAFVGSPGVGKSILFFLAALHRAQTIRTLYYRQTNADMASMFVMTPVGNGRVHVWFSRNLRKGRWGAAIGLSGIDVDYQFFLQNRYNYYTFVDGPRYQENNPISSLADLLDGRI